MRHHLYLMSSIAPAPAGDGDTRSWFFFYKWNVEGDTYVPQKRPFLEAEQGDVLWFVLDGCVLGGAPITRVELEYSANREEIWYRGESLLALPVPVPVAGAYLSARSVPANLGADWLASAQPLSRPASSSE